MGWPLSFFLVALLAAMFGYGGVAAGASGVAKILFFVFVVMFLVSLVIGLARSRSPTA